MEKSDKLMKCFIITPIGDEKSEIRRHIDGVIDAALKPIVEAEFNYKIEVAHRIDAPGNIPKQVILEVYRSDLVIANLTGNNPNVMYELALRHCFGKPAIIIAENSTHLPADIIGERTIFYVNDAQGVLELKKKLSDMIIKIEEETDTERSGPVYEALKSDLKERSIISAIEDAGNEGQADMLQLLLNKIDDLSLDLRRSSSSAIKAKEIKASDETHIIRLDYVLSQSINSETTQMIKRKLEKITGVLSIRLSPGQIRMGVHAIVEFDLNKITEQINTIIDEYPLNNVIVNIREIGC